jgi:hypothetical protein
MGVSDEIIYIVLSYLGLKILYDSESCAFHF